MASRPIIQPLCVSCRIALEQKKELDHKNGLLFQIEHCPNCGEIYNKWKVEN